MSKNHSMAENYKESRWHDTLVTSKTAKPVQKNRGKDFARSTVPACDGTKPTGSGAFKASVICGRSSSLSRGGDLSATGSKTGGSRGVLSHQGSVGPQAKRQGSYPARSAPRLRSSQSFSSLQASSLTAAPFMRSSLSLSRLDQRSTDSDQAATSSQVKRGRANRKKILDSGRLSSSLEQISSSSPSYLVSTTACHQHNTKGKKETRNEVYTLCAMTSGMRHNWVQAMLRNVRPNLKHNTTSSVSEQKAEQVDELGNCESTEDSHRTQHEQTTKQQPDGEQSQAGVGSSSIYHPVSSSASPAPSATSPPQQVEEDEAGMMDASCADGYQSDSSTSTVVMMSNDEDFETQSNTDGTTEKSLQQSETTAQKEAKQVSTTGACECTKYEEKPPSEHQTGQLVKELEQIQKELSRVQQLNRNLQDELQQERESKLFLPQNDASSTSEQRLALQRLQRVNHNLRMELEVLKRSQEEAREAELRRRVDLLAQQAQLLVTGDATALAQIQLEQDRQRFQEQQLDLERCVASLKAQLSTSEEKRRNTESHLAQLQQELESQQSLQWEAEQLRKNLQEMSARLRAYEEAQADKEARLQKHLMLLQASQDRERRSLAASLTKAEQHSRDLQGKLDRAEEQLENLNRSQALTREIEEAQQQLQEELACTVSAVQQLQEERDQLNFHCQELQNQLSEADGSMSRLQERLKTEETHYYNLEHSYERVCEELQLALGKVQQRESDSQDIREGYERLLDRKEQELCEVLLKMEVLGNSLEETELKLNEMMKVCTCASPQLKEESTEPVGQKDRQQEVLELFAVNESRTNAVDSSQLANSSNATHECKRGRSCSVDASYQYNSTAGDDQEKFMSTIQLLETKLFVTEEKLRDITQRLEVHQSQISCQDPHLYSQLTQSRATAQHLSLLLHSQAKQSQRFAQETENRCRVLVGRLQIALNIVQGCRERLQASAVNIPDVERQLATVAACLQQGEKDAERVQRDSCNASKEDGKILSSEKLTESERDIAPKSNNAHSLHVMLSVKNFLIRELSIIEKIVTVLQSQNGICQLSAASSEDERDMAHRYESMVSQIIALKTEDRLESGRIDCCSSQHLENIIGRVCAEAELIYATLKLQQQCESRAPANLQEEEHQREGLADISPSELAHCEEQIKTIQRSSEEAATLVEKDRSNDKKVKADKEPVWLERLVSQLQKRAKFLHQICQGITENDSCEGSMDPTGENVSEDDLIRIQEQVKLIYLSDRLYIDLEQESRQSEILQSKLQALCKEQDIKVMDEREALNNAFYQLQEDNSVLREELERAEQKIISVETGNQKLLEDIQKIENYHRERMQKLESEFQEKIKELQQIHEEEMKHLHGYYIKSCVSREKHVKPGGESPLFTDSTSSLPEQAVTQRKPKEDLQICMVGDDASAMREAYLKDLEKLQASCDQGFSAMEEMHGKLITDLQQQHQKQVAELLKEKDQLLQEETAATMAAIVAMRRAHKKELERSRQTQNIKESGNITELYMEYEKEIQLLHRELEALSSQHSEKCLENSQLSQELQDERKSVMQFQQENQELKQKQREADEMSKLHEQQSHVGPQLEMIVRAKDAEIQFLRQEARSLREELEVSQMDKVQKKLKMFSPNNHDGAGQHASKDSKFAGQHASKDSKFATWSTNRDTSAHSVDDSVKSTNNPAFPKREKSFLMRQIRGIRSKSLKDGLSLQERKKLFESF